MADPSALARQVLAEPDDAPCDCEREATLAEAVIAGEAEITRLQEAIESHQIDTLLAAVHGESQAVINSALWAVLPGSTDGRP